MRLRRLLPAVLLLAASGASAAVDPSLLQDLRWRLIGPFRGGRVLAVSGVPAEPAHFYFGSVNGGVWETHDAGRTWQPIFDSQPIGSIGALAVAPSNPRVIYVGSGEADMRSDIAQGDGMYKSTDGGKTWSHIGLADSQQIGRVLVDPPFEAQAGEFAIIQDALDASLARWPNAIHAIWYPIKLRGTILPFHRWLRQHGGADGALVAELLLHPDNTMLRLNGCGMAIVNPPWQFDREVSGWLPALEALLAQGRYGSSRVEMLKAT
jgi:hypothetical protein